MFERNEGGWQICGIPGRGHSRGEGFAGRGGGAVHLLSERQPESQVAGMREAEGIRRGGQG